MNIMRSIHQTLFADVFETSVPTVAKQRQGRSSTLISKRNQLLIDRYFFYSKVFDYSYPKVLSLLEQEMFLSTGTIPDLISDNLGMLISLKKEFKETPSEKISSHFKKKWPHIVW